jgi:hydrogenase maturation protein HypF
MPSTPQNIVRRRLVATGQVQGVGFRPFVFRLARDFGLSGFVRNAPTGVAIEVQGGQAAADGFAAELAAKLPPLARIVSLTNEAIEPVTGEAGFEIVSSQAGDSHSVLISPDVATCPDCLAELLDPNDRRHLYPFTNCTNCGPRYTITRSIPYDRPGTCMACFPMCPDCEREYRDPLDRRFHAQPNACPVCGPRVWLADEGGTTLAEADQALRELARFLAGGGIAAIKGLGGFHLACDATDQAAVRQLRRRKGRPHKPLAVMVPDLATARRIGRVGPEEEGWLAGRVRPIVLLQALRPRALAPSIAPDADSVGVMLPYAPLQHVLLAHYAALLDGGRPAALVMTSGNASSEPICLGNREAARRLAGIAERFLFHDRDILVRADDSVLRVVPGSGEPLFYRRARGFAPSPVFLPEAGPSVLGLGPELKATLCLTKADAAFVSQHIGDMENLDTLGFHTEILAHLENVLQASPKAVVHDLHPDYLTTRLAQTLAAQRGIPALGLQHHFAHAFAVLAENRHAGPAVCLALDGTGYGEDGTI